MMGHRTGLMGFILSTKNVGLHIVSSIGGGGGGGGGGDNS